MTRPRPALSSDGGWVLVPAIALIAIMLALGLALLAIVDTQTTASADERADNISFNTAEGVARSASLALGASDLWQSEAARTRAGNDAFCGTSQQTYDSGAGNPYGAALRNVLDQSYGTSGGTWRVNVCRVAVANEAWSDAYLTSRLAYATTDPATRDLLWVRGQTSVNGTNRAVVLKVQARRAFAGLPEGYAVKTGSFGVNDIPTTLGAITGSGLLSTVTGLLGASGVNTIEDTSSLLGIRCGILHLLNGQACITGTLAGVAGTTNYLGLGQLNGLLGINRFVQDTSRQTASEAQLDAWKAEARASGTYVDSIGNGTDCFAGVPAATAGKVVWIDSIASGTGTCNLTGTHSAKMLLIRRGRVQITGTFNGVLYLANRLGDASTDNPYGSADMASPPARLAYFVRPGTVTGAVFVDGSGSTEFQVRTTPVNCGLLGLNCLLGNLLTGLLGPDGYTAVTYDLATVRAAQANTIVGSGVAPGGFSQIAPN